MVSYSNMVTNTVCYWVRNKSMMSVLTTFGSVYLPVHARKEGRNKETIVYREINTTKTLLNVHNYLDNNSWEIYKTKSVPSM